MQRSFLAIPLEFARTAPPANRDSWKLSRSAIALALGSPVRQNPAQPVVRPDVELGEFLVEVVLHGRCTR